MEREGIEESSGLKWVGSGGSGTSRWVDGSEVDSDERPPWSRWDDEEFKSRHGSGSIRRRLVKKPKRVDSLDVEAMQIAGSYGHHNKVSYLFLVSISYVYSYRLLLHLILGIVLLPLVSVVICFSMLGFTKKNNKHLMRLMR